ncbi:fungal-specific transcription factor domain-containing protein [Favolaschia claudopus]|uniref:Fungal-specific transcription factor domain-containing protein n=1 Tax=Favolaschia claudopus TaxID=2862362 RepID=A0AAV9ZNG6_9AGAR
MTPFAGNLSVALVVCAECQRQKVKCDKKIPCGSCVRRGCDDICPTGTLLSTGRGKRSIMAHVPNLNSAIVKMGQRIRDLEEALASTQESTKSQNALWSKCILSTPPRTESTPTPSGDTLGSFVVNEHGETVYYGPVGGFEVFHSASKIVPIGRDGQLFTALTTSFPFSSSTEPAPPWDPTLSLDRLVIFVPSLTRAHTLCSLYFHNAAWHGTPLTQPEVASLLNLIYTRPSNPSLPPKIKITPHQLACSFLIFALGSIVDTAVSGVDSADGDCYFGLANAALSVKNVFFEEPELATVQAFTLLANYYTYISRKFSVETAWQTISMASSLAQRLGLHNESCVSRFPAPLADRCRGLFWELYACENIYGLAVGRPVSIRPESISCTFPQEEEEQEEDSTESAPFVKPLPGYRHARWKFVKDISYVLQIMAPVMETFLAIKKPSYETILKFDLKIRKFIQTWLPPLEAIDLPETDPPIKFLHRGSLRVLANQVLIFIHRDSFVEAMRISPTNPIQSPYSSSFLAAYRSAAEIVKATNRDCKRYPELLPRWCGTWRNSIEASIIVATVAIRYPNSDMNSEAHSISQVIADLLATVDILDGVAGVCANHIGFGILRNAIEKALALHSRHTDSQNQFQSQTGISLAPIYPHHMHMHAPVRDSLTDKPLNPAQCMAAEDLERDLKSLEQAAASLTLESVETTTEMANEHDAFLVEASNQIPASAFDATTIGMNGHGHGYRDRDSDVLFLPAEFESLPAYYPAPIGISGDFNARLGIAMSSEDAYARFWEEFLGSL